VNDSAPVIAGLLNFRDVGGPPVPGGGRIRFRTLYRSQAPSGLGPDGRSAIRALGLRAVLDLRDEYEVRQWPYELDDPATARFEVPVLGGLPVPPDQADLYLHMVEACGRGFTRAVRALADAGSRPILVHCAVGKDRTGLTVALALSAVGVADEAVLADFLLSNAGLNIPDPDEEAQAADTAGEAHEEEEIVDRYLMHHRVSAALMESSLERARQLGGDIPGYLAMHGMTDAELDALHATLVEPTAR
jgi:protein-tyrosine phosphatase